MSENLTSDLVVIGGGPAGVTAALRARELGAAVTLIERDRMGGTCTNDGCVPTRALAKAARLHRDAEQFATYGLVGELPQIDFARLMARTQQVVYTIHEKKQLVDQLESVGVRVLHGQGAAQFIDSHTVQVGEAVQISARNYVLAVGGHARRLDFPGAEYALTHSDVWSLKALPASVAIVGAAATGCQLASIFDAFGVKVWLFDVANRILPAEDEDTAAAVAAAFHSRGVQITTEISGIECIEKTSEGLRLVYRQGEAVHTLEVAAVILSVGWPGNLAALNLEAAGIESQRGYIQVDDSLRTSAAHIYAAGDITGRMMLVQSASFEARIAVENALTGSRQPATHQIVPHGGFTDPEYGSVGLTEAQARQQYEVVVARMAYAELDRAVIDDRTDGFCKLIVDRRTQRLLGAHVVGEQALEVVHLAAATMASNSTIEDLAYLELAYPTYTAVIGLAARRLAYELDRRPLSPQWRALGRPNLAEWERRSL